MENVKTPITAIIPTFNEEANIAKAIESVLWAQEIIIVDSFSTDKTIEIAKSFEGVTVIQHEYQNSAAQKNWTIPQAKFEWIFLLDADEVATPELIEEVKVKYQNPGGKVGFWIKRQSYFMGKRIKYSGWQGDKVVRLFMRDKCRYEDKKVHAEIVGDGAIGKLNNIIEHFTYKGVDHYLQKVRWYSTWKAYDKVEKGAPTGFFFNVILRPLYRFIQDYIVRLGILDGKQGLVISALNSYEVFLSGVKIWRIKMGEEIPKDK